MTSDGNGDRPDGQDWIAELAAQRRDRSRPTPRGRPVSSALILSPGALPRDRQMRALLATIDAVHGDGELPRIPIRWGIPPRNMVAQYRAAEDLVEPVSLRIDPNRSRWPLATIHEIGHFVDHCGLGETSTMASRSSALLEPWRQAVRATRAFRTLVNHHGSPRYLTADEELWARSYAQWIATRSDEGRLKIQVVQSRGDDPRSPTYFTQWDDDDFGDIANEITGLFRRLGWID